MRFGRGIPPALRAFVRRPHNPPRSGRQAAAAAGGRGEPSARAERGAAREDGPVEGIRSIRTDPGSAPVDRDRIGADAEERVRFSVGFPGKGKSFLFLSFFFCLCVCFTKKEECVFLLWFFVLPKRKGDLIWGVFYEGILSLEIHWKPRSSEEFVPTGAPLLRTKSPILSNHPFQTTRTPGRTGSFFRKPKHQNRSAGF